ncbi:MAG: hypothetical protein Q9175_001074 [Cornicularia normoerica]
MSITSSTKSLRDARKMEDGATGSPAIDSEGSIYAGGTPNGGRYHGHVQVYVPNNHPISAMSVPKGTQLRNATMQAGTFEEKERNRREREKRGKS